jgi:steroid delta-isomerase-like uncharacterized protein
MTHDEIRAFFEQQVRDWRNRDARALSAAHAPDGVIESPIFRTVVGAHNIGVSYTTLFDIFPDWELVESDVLIDGDRFAQTFTVTATHQGDFMGLQGTGKRFTIHGVRVVTMRDGKIQHERRYYDFTGLLIQIGVLKGKPGY